MDTTMIYGSDNRELMEGVRRHADFKDFVVPISELKEIRDATFFLRKDGLLAFSEGYYHPKGKLIANIIYIPDPNGTKKFFGTQYGSIIKQYRTEGEAWIPFVRQLEIYRAIDPSTQEGKPVFAENKCIFNVDEFIGFVPPRRSLAIARKRSGEIDRSIGSIGKLLGIAPEMIGCTGSMAFGNLAAAHDFDLVFHGTLAKLRRAVGRIYEIVKDPKRAVFEMGMHWAIRFYDDEGDMICPFFSYTDPAEIPLPSFEMEVLERGVEAVGTVANDDHTGFMPTWLPLADARIGSKAFGRDAALIIYHGGKRGEYRTGDRVKARGYRVGVTAPRARYEAVLVTDMDNTEKL
jgi:hypothetical protein